MLYYSLLCFNFAQQRVSPSPEGARYTKDGYRPSEAKGATQP
jgi:hypothetical protein